MKHEYLIELLSKNKTVIIPNVGAISKNDGGTPPFAFNEYLKFNDGMIVKYIAEKEGKTLDDAGSDLEKFTQNFYDLLSKGQDVVIPKIGVLTKKDGKIILQDINTTDVPSSKISNDPPVILNASEGPSEGPKIEPIVEKKIEPVVEKKVEPIVEKKVEPVIEKKVEPIVEKKVEPVIEKKSVMPSVSEGPKKKKRKLVWIIILILLLGGGGTAGFIFKDQLMELIGLNKSEQTAEKEKKDESSSNKEEVKEEPKEEVVVEETPVVDSIIVEEEIIEDTPIEEETKTEVPKEENKTIAAPVTNVSPGNYYVIVGCFSNQTNADNMSAKVSSTGLSPSNIGTFNGLIHIAAGSASDMQGALQIFNSVKGSFPSAWIMKR